MVCMRGTMVPRAANKFIHFQDTDYITVEEKKYLGSGLCSRSFVTFNTGTSHLMPHSDSVVCGKQEGSLKLLLASRVMSNTLTTRCHSVSTSQFPCF